MIPYNGVGPDGVFGIQSCGEWLCVNRDFMKNKKSVLEKVATRILFPGREKVKTFKEKKEKLVEMITPHIIFEKSEDLDDWEKVEGVDLKNFKFPAGEVYIGDLCHAMKDSVYRGVWVDKFDCEVGFYRRKSDGACFAMEHTQYGDGVFVDTWSYNGCAEYGVDSGCIGIASMALCHTDNLSDDQKDFSISNVGGEIECKFTGYEFNFRSSGKSGFLCRTLKAKGNVEYDE